MVNYIFASKIKIDRWYPKSTFKNIYQPIKPVGIFVKFLAMKLSLSDNCLFFVVYALCYLCIWFSSPYLSSLFLHSFKYKRASRSVPFIRYPSCVTHLLSVCLTSDYLSQERGKDAEAISALLPFNLGSLWGEERDIGCFVYSCNVSFSAENETGQQANCYEL